MPIKEFLETGIEPRDEAEAKRLRRLTPSYTLIDEILYKKGSQHHYLDASLLLGLKKMLYTLGGR